MQLLSTLSKRMSNENFDDEINLNAGIGEDDQISESKSNPLVDDINGVFDDDGSTGDIAADGNVFFFDVSGQERLSGETAKSDRPSDGNEKSETNKPLKQKKKRQSFKYENQGDKALPPPRWHSEAADKTHRKALVYEIAKLLKMRKKSQPSAEWMRQLPHKAKKLEQRLYRTAPSLESYLDRKTLKVRLQTVAKAITTQYNRDKTRRLSYRSNRSSITSQSSLSSFGSFSNRDSITSIDSLRSLQLSLNEKASFLDEDRRPSLKQRGSLSLIDAQAESTSKTSTINEDESGSGKDSEKQQSGASGSDAGKQNATQDAQKQPQQQQQQPPQQQQSQQQQMMDTMRTNLPGIPAETALQAPNQANLMMNMMQQNSAMMGSHPNQSMLAQNQLMLMQHQQQMNAQQQLNAQQQMNAMLMNSTQMVGGMPGMQMRPTFPMQPMQLMAGSQAMGGMNQFMMPMMQQHNQMQTMAMANGGLGMNPAMPPPMMQPQMATMSRQQIAGGPTGALPPTGAGSA